MERLKPENLSQLFFNKVKKDVKTIFEHPAIPKDIGEKALFLLNTVRIVTDEEADKIQLRYNDLPVPAGFHIKSKQIFIKKKFVENTSQIVHYLGNPLGYIALFETLSEEISHGLGVDKKIPLSKIEDDSLFIFPYKGKEEFIKDLKIISSQILTEDVILQINGFCTSFKIGTAILSPSPIQEQFEELRVNCLKAFFSSLNLGIKKLPEQNLTNQLDKGMEMFLQFVSSRSIPFPTTSLSLLFLNTFLQISKKASNTQERSHELLQRLTNQTIDEFCKEMDTYQKQIFFNLANATAFESKISEALIKKYYNASP